MIAGNDNLSPERAADLARTEELERNAAAAMQELQRRKRREDRILRERPDCRLAQEIREDPAFSADLQRKAAENGRRRRVAQPDATELDLALQDAIADRNNGEIG